LGVSRRALAIPASQASQGHAELAREFAIGDAEPRSRELDDFCRMAANCKNASVRER